MGYNLCIDIGNTNIKSGIFNDGILLEKYLGDEFLEKIFEKYNINNCIISSVRKKIPDNIYDIKKRVSNFMVLCHKTKLPVKINYKTPETLGRDRIAAAIGAKKIFPDKNCIVIDAGTCITYDFIDKDNVFQGGNIAPGLSMRLEAMHRFTNNLPKVKLAYNEDPLGKSTDEALQNGSLRGTFWEISSFIQLILDKFGDSKVIFTGGDAKYFVNHFKTTIFANPNLVLIGLNEIIKENE